MVPPKTKSSTPTLSEAARHIVIPKGIVTTGWPRIKARLADMAITYDPWQEGAARVALGKRKDGKYAATVGGVTWSIPRQVGKTFTLGSLLIAMCIEFPGLRVVWTSHHGGTSNNTFRVMQGMVKKQRIRRHLAAGRNEGIRASHGEQEIAFRNGSVILFGARAQGFGRGIDKIDVEVFDEAQILTERALDDMVAATMQSQHPHGALLFFIGTPPRPNIDDGESFSLRRTKALSGKTRDAFYLEFSADPDADPDDREQWAKANPSYPKRTPLESMLRLRENLGSDESWKREAMGIWDAVAAKGVIPAQSWQDQADEGSVMVDRISLGVEVGEDQKWASVSLAGQRQDGDWSIELDADQHTRGRGVLWLVPHLDYLVSNNPQIRSIVADVAGPIKPLLNEVNGNWFLKREDGGNGLRITPLKVAELGAGCSQILSGIVSGNVWHIDQPQFNAAALTATKRALGDTGMWVWSRKGSDSDITPIQAATYALIGAQNEQAIRPQPRRGGRRVVTW